MATAPHRKLWALGRALSNIGAFNVLSRILVWLPNKHGHATLHEPVRLEVRGTGLDRAIYPVYRCTKTLLERDYGYLRAGTGVDMLQVLFGPVELVGVADERAA